MKKVIVNLVLIGLVLVGAITAWSIGFLKDKDSSSESTKIVKITDLAEDMSELSAQLEASKEPEEKPETETKAGQETKSEQEAKPETESKAETESKPAQESKPEGQTEKSQVCVSEIFAKRVSRNKINITFNTLKDIQIEKYYLMRKEAFAGSDWVVCQEIDGNTADEVCSVDDTLDSDSLKQYLYCIRVKPADEEHFEGISGNEVLISNALICIDPGHYKGKNKVADDDEYAEGDYTIKIGLALQEILKNKYGIDSCLTRDGSSITLGGYTDANLDKGHISLRGEYAGEQGSDLFISLHTNANNDNANGYPTCYQPISINKTVVLANVLACERDDIINIGNSIGLNVSQVNYENGLSDSNEFEIKDKNNLKEWTSSFNDSLNVPGAVCYRLGQNGDYYGVLRGATNAGVPGLIVEHGMHTIAELRQTALSSDLYRQWAEADAYGIAYGLGFETDIKMAEQ